MSDVTNESSTAWLTDLRMLRSTEADVEQQSCSRQSLRCGSWLDWTSRCGTSSQCHCRHTTRIMTGPISSNRMHSDPGLFWTGVRCTIVHVADWCLEHKQWGHWPGHGWQLVSCSSHGASSGWCHWYVATAWIMCACVIRCWCKYRWQCW